MMLEWVGEDTVDPATGQMVQNKEFFVPEFDIEVKILDEKPTDRNYYTQTALNLYPTGLMTKEDVWYTLDEGKFPPKDDVLEHLRMQDMMMQMMQGMQALQPDAQQALMNLMQSAMGQLAQQQPPQKPGEKPQPKQPGDMPMQ
jgi:hypothetical protein